MLGSQFIRFFETPSPTSCRRDAGIPVPDERHISYLLLSRFWQHVAAFVAIFLYRYLWQMQARRIEGPPAGLADGLEERFRTH